MASRPVFDALQELKAYLDDLQRTTYSMFDSVLARYVALIQPGTPLGNIAVCELPAVNFDEWSAQGVASMGGMVGSGQLHWPVDRRSRVALTRELLLRMADGKPGLHDFTHVFLYAGGHFDDQIRAFVSQVVEPFHRDFVAIVNPYLQTEKRAAAEEISVSDTTRPTLATLSATTMAAPPFVNTTRIESLRALDRRLLRVARRARGIAGEGSRATRSRRASARFSPALVKVVRCAGTHGARRATETPGSALYRLIRREHDTLNRPGSAGATRS